MTQTVDVDRVRGQSTDALLLIRQHPQSRRFHRIGRLTRTKVGGYCFEYLPAATTVEGFEPLLQFPAVDEPNLFAVLPPFFENRVLATERENYDEYLGWLGLEPDDENLPMEFLARTGGSRVTDPFHLVPELPTDGGLYSRCFVACTPHHDPDDQVIANLCAGDKLNLNADEDFDGTPPAVFTVTRNATRIGNAPDRLTDGINELLAQGKQLSVEVEKVSPGSPYHLRVLCRIEVSDS